MTSMPKVELRSKLMVINLSLGMMGLAVSREASIRRSSSRVVFGPEVKEDHVESFSGEENGGEELREAWCWSKSSSCPSKYGESFF